MLALILSVPCMSVGVALSLLKPGMFGQTSMVICQVWLVVLPALWHIWVRRDSVKLTPPRPSDWLVGGVVGLSMAGVILLAYETLLRYWINLARVQAVLESVGGIDRTTFLLFAVYLILINALLEEYFWRWFVYCRCEEWVGSKPAIFLSAFFFTPHHTLGLAIFTDWRIAFVGSMAVFAAGAIWCEIYRRRRSIWRCYISHAVAVVALNIVAWQVFFP